MKNYNRHETRNEILKMIGAGFGALIGGALFLVFLIAVLWMGYDAGLPM